MTQVAPAPLSPLLAAAIALATTALFVVFLLQRLGHRND
jgi:hypothetical protein